MTILKESHFTIDELQKLIFVNDQLLSKGILNSCYCAVACVSQEVDFIVGSCYLVQKTQNVALQVFYGDTGVFMVKDIGFKTDIIEKIGLVSAFKIPVIGSFEMVEKMWTKTDKWLYRWSKVNERFELIREGKETIDPFS